MFEEFGAVDSVDLLSDRYTGESRGFGFVKMDTKAGRAAIDALDKKAIGGRPLKVNEAKPRASGGGFQQRGQGGAFGSGGRHRY
jgi:RNA recognition motif-containing protein